MVQHSTFYRLYLKSDLWYNVRKVKIAQMKVCEECGGTKILQCHHLTYKRLGRERLSDLKLLCRKCHDEVKDGMGTNG